MKKSHLVRIIILPLIIFGCAYLLRRYFFCGFILGDDAEEFILFLHVLHQAPIWSNQLHLRFGGWIFNLLSFKLLGVSELSFFLPTLLFSASLSVIGYYILTYKKYNVPYAFLAGLVIASAPFEVLIGTVRANDLILSWVLATGLLLFIVLEKKPLLQGVSAAFFLWFGFYTKLWAVYLLPVLGMYYLIQIIRRKIWRGVLSFVVSSLLLHGVTCIIWKGKTGFFLPFIHTHAANYHFDDLSHLFAIYPKLIFIGSGEFGTTLFGSIPYLLLFGLFMKLVFSLVGTFRRFDDLGYRFDMLDFWLFMYYSSFFLLLNFFPNSFIFDKYYSVPRIFRYLALLSFPMTLHVTKLIVDLAGFKSNRLTVMRYGVVFLLTGLIVLNTIQTGEATEPGQIYYKNLQAVVKDIQQQSPPILLTEITLSRFMSRIYLRNEADKIQVMPISNTYKAGQYETWLKKNQSRFPTGTMLLTGLGSYVHYGAHLDGFRLTQFQSPLHPAWELFKTYGMLDYLPYPEPARLWQLSRQIASDDPELLKQDSLVAADNESASLFTKGMELFHRHEYFFAQKYFQKITTAFSNAPEADDALYFYTICFFRENNWVQTIREFRKLMEIYPQSMWVGAAHYHIGVSLAALGKTEQARKSFEYVIEHFPEDKVTVGLAREQLQKIM